MIPSVATVQGAEQQPYQMMAFYDQNGSLVMGPRTGTPMRLVSPAPQVLVPPGAARAPQAPPAIYPPQQAQQNHMNQSQNGYNVSGGCHTTSLQFEPFFDVYYFSLLQVVDYLLHKRLVVAWEHWVAQRNLVLP